MDLEDIGVRLRTQDNRATEHPLFLVQEEVFDIGFHQDYAERQMWVDEEGSLHEEEPDCLATRVNVRARWEFVTACLTEQGAHRYINRERHNHGHLRIYAVSANRNPEMIAIIEHMKEQS